jgi:hypothetical protein
MGGSERFEPCWVASLERPRSRHGGRFDFNQEFGAGEAGDLRGGRSMLASRLVEGLSRWYFLAPPTKQSVFLMSGMTTSLRSADFQTKRSEWLLPGLIDQCCCRRNLSGWGKAGVRCSREGHCAVSFSGYPTQERMSDLLRLMQTG